VAKLVWRVKLVAELQPGVTTETEVARIECDEQATLAELGLRLDEAKQLTAALQAPMVPAQVTVLSACRRSCVACGSTLASKGHYRVRFRSLFGDVPLRVGRLLACPCQGGDEAKSSAVLDFGGNAVAPELAYLTARYAALVPFGKVCCPFVRVAAGRRDAAREHRAEQNEAGRRDRRSAAAFRRHGKADRLGRDRA
jgi:hypothetical protein